MNFVGIEISGNLKVQYQVSTAAVVQLPSHAVPVSTGSSIGAFLCIYVVNFSETEYYT